MTDNLDWSKIALFDGFSEEWRARARGIFDRLDVPAGTLLIEEGQSGDEMYILIRGRVRVTKSMLLKDMSLPLAVVENPRKVLATLDGSRFPLFGEIALIDRDTRSATVAVLEDSQFLRTNRERFFGLMESEPALAARLLLILAKRFAATIRKGNTELVKLSTALALALSRGS
ncbi:cyclic nucleotide-binding domain-containing protein [Desulfovibrio aminophilus]|uniref:cyclic nucleotide-binding domain-containing protein n=1 Tax=Desulfovibrio aminophilus TaxID=81425 RepID=UPI003397076D